MPGLSIKHHSPVRAGFYSVQERRTRLPGDKDNLE